MSLLSLLVFFYFTHDSQLTDGFLNYSERTNHFIFLGMTGNKKLVKQPKKPVKGFEMGVKKEGQLFSRVKRETAKAQGNPIGNKSHTHTHTRTQTHVAAYVNVCVLKHMY